MNIQKINAYNNVHFKSSEPTVQESSLLKQDAPNDVVEISKKEVAQEEHDIPKKEKQEIVRQANTTAAGWATFFGIFSTAYFGLRSDKTVAKKYNLDVEKDKKLIKTIKTNQLIWTLPGIIPSVGFATGVAAWLFNKNRDPEKIDIDRF